MNFLREGFLPHVNEHTRKKDQRPVNKIRGHIFIKSRDHVAGQKYNHKQLQNVQYTFHHIVKKIQNTPDRKTKTYSDRNHEPNPSIVQPRQSRPWTNHLVTAQQGRNIPQTPQNLESNGTCCCFNCCCFSLISCWIYSFIHIIHFFIKFYF